MAFTVATRPQTHPRACEPLKRILIGAIAVAAYVEGRPGGGRSAEPGPCSASVTTFSGPGRGNSGWSEGASTGGLGASTGESSAGGVSSEGSGIIASALRSMCPVRRGPAFRGAGPTPVASAFETAHRPAYPSWANAAQPPSDTAPSKGPTLTSPSEERFEPTTGSSLPCFRNCSVLCVALTRSSALAAVPVGARPVAGVGLSMRVAVRHVIGRTRRWEIAVLINRVIHRLHCVGHHQLLSIG